MTKNYIQPTIEVMAVNATCSICAASGAASGNSLNVSSETFGNENEIL